jgi:hypothetical protein
MLFPLGDVLGSMLWSATVLYLSCDVSLLFQDNTKKAPSAPSRSTPFKLFSTHYAILITKFNAGQYRTLMAAISKPQIRHKIRGTNISVTK